MPPPAIEDVRPYDGSVIDNIELVGADQIDRALATARVLSSDRDAWLPLHERVAILERTAELRTANRERVAPEEDISRSGNPCVFYWLENKILLTTKQRPRYKK